MKRTDIAVVTWDDAVRHDDGGPREPVHKAERQTLVGWLLKWDDAGISVAGEYNQDDGSWRDENFIPSGMIVRVELWELG